MRYYQSGGGYFPFEVTDKGERIQARKDYLSHCENVVKRGNIGSRVSRNALREELKLPEERGINPIEEKEYSYKKRLLSTIEKSIDSRNYLIKELKLDVERGIEKHYSKSPLLARIHQDKDMIFKSCRDWISKNMKDENCLMTVNVVSLQIVILFTYASLDYRHPTFEDWHYDKEKHDSWFSRLIFPSKLGQFQKTTYYNWRNFKHVYNRANSISPIITEFLRSGIITVLDNLSIDTIIKQYLNGWYTCQIVYKKTFADSREMLPFEYMRHDLVHYNNFVLNNDINKKFAKRNHKWIFKNDTLKRFYDFMNMFECEQEQKYSVKVIFFIVIHEAMGKWFEDEIFKGNLADENHEIYEGDLWFERFDSENDLLLLIPYDYRPSSIRESESQKDETKESTKHEEEKSQKDETKESIKHEEEKSPTRADRRVAYLNTALANYLYVLEEFKRREFGEKVFSIEYKSLDKQRLKRVEDMMKWKEEDRPIPELLLYTKELESLGCELCSPTCCVSGGTRKRKKRKNKTRKSPGTVSHRHSL